MFECRVGALGNEAIFGAVTREGGPGSGEQSVLNLRPKRNQES